MLLKQQCEMILDRNTFLKVHIKQFKSHAKLVYKWAFFINDVY
jgi:hypothetical protein